MGICVTRSSLSSKGDIDRYVIIIRYETNVPYQSSRSLFSVRLPAEGINFLKDILDKEIVGLFPAMTLQLSHEMKYVFHS
jgi:hypothetical protein